MIRSRAIVLTAALAIGAFCVDRAAAAPLPASLWTGTGLNILITLEEATVTSIDVPAPIIEATLLDGMASFSGTPYAPRIDCPEGGTRCEVGVGGEYEISATNGRVESSFRLPGLTLGIRSALGGTLTLFVAQGGAGGQSPGAEPEGIAEIVFFGPGEWKLADQDDFYFEGPPMVLDVPAGDSFLRWEGLSIDSVAERRLTEVADVPAPGASALVLSVAIAFARRRGRGMV